MKYVFSPEKNEKPQKTIVYKSGDSYSQRDTNNGLTFLGYHIVPDLG